MDDVRSVHLHPPSWMPLVLLLAVAVGGGFYVYGKSMEGLDRMPAQISVSGEGKSTAAPDVGELSFGVRVERRPSARDAMDRLATTMNAVLDAVKAAGVPEKDISTESLSLNPAYDWAEGRQISRGYDASQSLRVKVRDLDKVSDVLAAATNAGANQAGGVNFIVDDPEKARAEARAEAIEQAEAKAKVLAEQLGMTLGKLKGFSEGGGYVPPMPYAGRAVMAMDAAQEMAKAPELPAGEQEVRVQVSITYELE